jgi:hypothetical protein
MLKYCLERTGLFLPNYLRTSSRSFENESNSLQEADTINTLEFACENNNYISKEREKKEKI